jgi:hypothetical protein
VQAIKKNIKLNNKRAMTVDEKATSMLFKASGLVAHDPLSDEAQDLFGEQFIDPMKESLVHDMRVTFGIAGEEGMHAVNALITEDED